MNEPIRQLADELEALADDLRPWDALAGDMPRPLFAFEAIAAKAINALEAAGMATLARKLAALPATLASLTRIDAGEDDTQAAEFHLHDLAEQLRQVAEPMAQAQQPAAETASIESRTLDRINAAKFLGISPRLLDDKTKRGEIRRIKIGGRVLYRPADLDDYLKRESEKDSRKRGRR